MLIIYIYICTYIVTLKPHECMYTYVIYIYIYLYVYIYIIFMYKYIFLQRSANTKISHVSRTYAFKGNHSECRGGEEKERERKKEKR